MDPPEKHKENQLEEKLEEMSDERITQIIEDRLLLKEIPEDTITCLFIGDNICVLADRLPYFPDYKLETIPFSPEERAGIITAYCKSDVNCALFFVESSYKPCIVTVGELNTKRARIVNTILRVPQKLFLTDERTSQHAFAYNRKCQKQSIQEEYARSN